MSHARVRAYRDEDPLASWPNDKPLPIKVVDALPPVVGADSFASSVREWGFFEGALLGVGLQRSADEGLRIEGSAVMIAPGLDITASHVFQDVWKDLEHGQEIMSLQGIRSDGTMDHWDVTRIVASPEDDMAMLAVELKSKIHADWYISTFPLTTHTPVIGELITIIGFREEKERRRVDLAKRSKQSTVGDIYVAQGSVGQFFPDKRDSSGMPFPGFEILCGSFGSMSGGAVLDPEGKLVGLISRGLTTDAMDGPTYATVINELLTRKIRLTWPPGFYEDQCYALHEIDPKYLRIEGRDKLVWRAGRLGYQRW